MLRKPAPSSSCPPVMVCGRGNDRNGRFSSELTRKNCNPAKPKRILWSCSKCATIGIMCPHRAKVSRHQHTLPTADQPGRSPSRRDNVSDKPTRPNMGRIGKSSLSGASETAGEPLRASVGAYFSGARTLRASEPGAGRCVRPGAVSAISANWRRASPQASTRLVVRTHETATSSRVSTETRYSRGCGGAASVVWQQGRPP